MKILRAIHTINPALGGPIESVMQSSSALLQRGHQVEIISLDRPDDPWVRNCFFKVQAMGPGRGQYGYTSQFTRWIRKQRGNYDALVVHGIWQYHSFGVWRALHGTPTPYFVFAHGMLDPWFKRAYPLKHVKKLIYWMLAERRVLRDAAAVLFTSDEERRLARDSFPLYQCNEVVVNYGTAAPDLDLESARDDFFDKFPRLRSQRFLLFLGRLHEKKGCELLIRAFAALRNSEGRHVFEHLVMAGPCADERYLERLKRMASSTSGISFTGMLSGSCKWGAISAADAFILSSHQENFGIAVAEALACGTPVLISNKINIWREVLEANAGYVEDDDFAGTSKLIERWAMTGPNDRSAMKENAKRCFMGHFEIDRATESLVEVLERSIDVECRVMSGQR